MAKHGGGGGGGHKESHGGGGGGHSGGGGGSGELSEIFSLATLREIFLEPLSSKEKKAAVLQTILWLLGAGYWASTMEGIVAAEGIEIVEKEMGLGGGKKGESGGGHELGGHGGGGGGGDHGGGKKSSKGGGGQH